MIKKIVKHISNYGASRCSMKGLIHKSGQAIVLPFYHAVTDENPIHIKHLYTPRSVEAFKNDIEFLTENYTSISLEKLIELQRGDAVEKQNYFHLTFDDGLSEFYEVVAPILKEKNIHATVFLNSDFIDNKKMFFRFKASILYDKLGENSILKRSYQEEHILDELALQMGIDFNAYLKDVQPYLSSAQIKALIADGFTFGAHSKDHPLFKDLNLEQQLLQAKESLDLVTSNFELPYKVFSFPFTDDQVSMSFFDGIAKETALTFGCAGLKEDSAKNNLQRIPMETQKTGKQIIKEEYLYYLLKAKVGKNKIFRQ